MTLRRGTRVIVKNKKGEVESRYWLGKTQPGYNIDYDDGSRAWVPESLVKVDVPNLFDGEETDD